MAQESSGAGGGSLAWKQPGNNRHLLALQHGPVAASSGAITIEYFGHCAFLITSPAGLTMLFDPWRNDPSGAFGLWFSREFPRQAVDVCVSTHAHFDHDALYAVDATSVLDRAAGKWNFADVTMTGVADKHALSSSGSLNLAEVVREFGAEPFPPDNPGSMDMVSYVVETGGLRILIWGDNRHDPPEEIWNLWGGVDVLTLPVDGSCRILDYRQANLVVDRLKPKIVIPSHYLMKGTSLALSALRTADEWFQSQEKKRLLDSPKLTLNASDLVSTNGEIYYFGAHVSAGA